MIRRLFHWKDKTNIESEVWKVFAKLRAGESSLSVHKRLTMMTKMMTKNAVLWISAFIIQSTFHRQLQVREERGRLRAASYNAAKKTFLIHCCDEVYADIESSDVCKKKKLLKMLCPACSSCNKLMPRRWWKNGTTSELNKQNHKCLDI